MNDEDRWPKDNRAIDSLNFGSEWQLRLIDIMPLYPWPES